MRAIGLAAGVTDAAIYYHFSSKAAILRALLVEPEVMPPHADGGAGPDIEALTEEITGIFWRWAEQPELWRIIVVGGLEYEPSTVDFFASAGAGYRRLVEPLLQPWYPEPAAIVETLRFVLTGVILETVLNSGDHIHTALRHPGYRRRVRRLVSLILKGGLESAAPGLAREAAAGARTGVN